ncbi:MAG: hypothetical protein ABR555_07530 [Pyrinomonadaceae bacterium]
MKNGFHVAGLVALLMLSINASAQTGTIPSDASRHSIANTAVISKPIVSTTSGPSQAATSASTTTRNASKTQLMSSTVLTNTKPQTSPSVSGDVKPALPTTTTPNSKANLLDASTKITTATEELLTLQEEAVKAATLSAAQLQQLYSEGLVARVEMEKSEQNLVAAKAKVEETKAEIANSQRLAAEIKKAEEIAKSTKSSLTKSTLMRVGAGSSGTVLRSSGSGGWSIGQLGTIQRFFSDTFRHALPTSAIGQSGTHDRLGYDHRNAVDVALHPDSVEGRALIAYLQSAGIPYLAFRSAIPGVATGPHIHIGSPSHRLS